MVTICSISAAVGLKLTVTLICMLRFAVFRRNVPTTNYEVIFESIIWLQWVALMKWEAQNSTDDKDKSSKHIRSPHDEVVSEVALIPIKQSAREEASKHKDLAQTTVQKLHELVEEMWSFRLVQYKDTVKRASYKFHSTDDSEPCPPTFFPRLNKTVGEKKLDPKVLLRQKAPFVYDNCMLHYARVARVIHKHATSHSFMLASSGRKQLNTNARKHTAVQLHLRNVDTAFQWCKWPQTCEVMLRSDAWHAVRPALGMNHWEAKSTLW